MENFVAPRGFHKPQQQTPNVTLGNILMASSSRKSVLDVPVALGMCVLEKAISWHCGSISFFLFKEIRVHSPQRLPF
jgi:hypothetical protein